jgi:hypothetical protein
MLVRPNLNYICLVCTQTNGERGDIRYGDFQTNPVNRYVRPCRRISVCLYYYPVILYIKDDLATNCSNMCMRLCLPIFYLIRLPNYHGTTFDSSEAHCSHHQSNVTLPLFEHEVLLIKIEKNEYSYRIVNHLLNCPFYRDPFTRRDGTI